MSGSAETRAPVRRVTPASRVEGTFTPPGSKSIAQRALIAAGLCEGTSEVRGLPGGADVRGCLALVRAWGAQVEAVGEGTVRIRGTRPGRLAPPDTVALGESGSLARFASAALGLCGPRGRPIRLEASGTLRRRGSEPLFAALVAAGVRVEREAAAWPVRLFPAVPPARFELDAPVSSQEVSALWLALSAFAWPHTVAVRGPIPSRPYLSITRAVLERFGVEVIGRPGERGRIEFRVRGPLQAPRGPIEVEADASSAAVALAAACLSGGALEVRGLPPGSPQGDVRIVEHLRAFGCAAYRTEQGLAASGLPTRSATLDLGGEPDLAPVLAAVAAAAALREGATSVLEGLVTLPAKESDRLSVLAEGLRAVGCAVEVGRDSLRIGPGDSAAAAAEVGLDPRGDHRMAFAFGLLGLLRAGVSVRDPECVAKSWPSFWEDLRRLGAEVADTA